MTVQYLQCSTVPRVQYRAGAHNQLPLSHWFGQCMATKESLARTDFRIFYKWQNVKTPSTRTQEKYATVVHPFLEVFHSSSPVTSELSQLQPRDRPASCPDWFLPPPILSPDPPSPSPDPPLPVEQLSSSYSFPSCCSSCCLSLQSPVGRHAVLLLLSCSLVPTSYHRMEWGGWGPPATSFPLPSAQNPCLLPGGQLCRGRAGGRGSPGAGQSGQEAGHTYHLNLLISCDSLQPTVNCRFCQKMSRKCVNDGHLGFVWW